MKNDSLIVDRAKEACAICDRDDAIKNLEFWKSRLHYWNANLEYWIDTMACDARDPGINDDCDEFILVAVKALARAKLEADVYKEALDRIDVDMGIKAKRA